MKDDPLYRQPPFNLEAEQALLGAVLVNNDAYERVSGFLEAQHFYDPLHQQIFATQPKLRLGQARRSDYAQSLHRGFRAD